MCSVSINISLLMGDHAGLLYFQVRDALCWLLDLGSLMMTKHGWILKDSYNRPIRDLRVSLTDRCNFRCFYCLPHGEPPIAPKEQMLSYEEIEYVCDIFVELGIEKIRLTGGEPMMRRDIERSLFEKLAAA